jgi:hypothetical protein
MKYSLVQRELVMKNLKNPSRQRRNAFRLFEDLNILMQEANYTDDYVLSKSREKPSQTNTVALNMSLGLVSRAMFDYLQQGFALEIYGLHELPMIFTMLKVTSNMVFSNKKNTFASFTEDLMKRGIHETDPRFVQYKKKFPPMQKLVCDEINFYRAVSVAYGAMFKLTIALVKGGAIVDILENHEVSKQTYNGRLAPF